MNVASDTDFSASSYLVNIVYNPLYIQEFQAQGVEVGPSAEMRIQI